MYNIDLLMTVSTIFIAILLFAIVVMNSVYEVEVYGRRFHEMSSSEKLEMLMNNPKEYEYMKELGKIYEKTRN